MKRKVDFQRVKRSKEKFLQVFYFEAFFKTKRVEKVMKRCFKVHSTSYLSARQRVDRFFSKQKNFKLMEVYQIQKHQLKAGLVVKELGIKKDQKFSMDRIDFRRLTKIRHKELGDIWIANPEVIVSRDCVGRELLFYKPISKRQVILKGILFDPKYFDLDATMKKRVFMGMDQERRSAFTNLEMDIARLKLLSDRAMSVGIDLVQEAVNSQIIVANKQYMAITSSYANQIVKDVKAMRKVPINDRPINALDKRTKNKLIDTGAKDRGIVSKLGWVDCIRRVFNSEPLYNTDDINMACSILRSQGIQIPSKIEYFLGEES